MNRIPEYIPKRGDTQAYIENNLSQEGAHRIYFYKLGMRFVFFLVNPCFHDTMFDDRRSFV